MAPIVIGAYGDGPLPILTGSLDCLNVTGSNVVVRDVQADGCEWAGIQVEGANDVVTHSVLAHSAAGVVVTPQAQSATVAANSIVDNNRLSTNTSSDSSGAFGVLLQGDDSTVAGNRIAGSAAPSEAYGEDGSAVEVYGGRNNVIAGNVAVNNEAFTELGNPRSRDNHYFDNTVVSALASAEFLITRGPYDRFGPVLGTDAERNTVVLTGPGTQGFVCYAGCSPDLLTLRDNTIQATAKEGYADGPIDEDNNRYFGGGAMQFSPGPHDTHSPQTTIPPPVG